MQVSLLNMQARQKEELIYFCCGIMDTADK
jgi:hypothetical protein